MIADQTREHVVLMDQPTDQPTLAAPAAAAAKAGDLPAALNLKQVARLLDVHYMTVYRYVRHGRLPAHREGTGWLVDRADALAFRAGAAVAAPGSTVDWAERLAGRLRVGDEVGAWSVVRDALSAGHDAERVHLDVIAGAIAHVAGAETTAVEVAVDERIALTTASRLVARLGGQFTHRGRKRGTVVLATPPGEHHGLSLAIVANLVRHAGFQALELGTDASAAHLLAAVGRVDDLVAVGLSVTVADRFEATVGIIRELRAVHPDLPVLVGGQAVRNRTVADLAGASAWSAGPDLVPTLERLAADRATARASVRSS
ncbi:cobalamin-dependent protein [Aquihabitans sp. McL0605]|uniref:cobalamin-dependent protein n=1 Tax=Aquihabitans sp. McL0605 TaxID=3415671 RepID=UPI003CF86141